MLSLHHPTISRSCKQILLSSGASLSFRSLKQASILPAASISFLRNAADIQAYKLDTARPFRETPSLLSAVKQPDIVRYAVDCVWHSVSVTPFRFSQYRPFSDTPSSYSTIAQTCTPLSAVKRCPWNRAASQACRVDCHTLLHTSLLCCTSVSVSHGQPAFRFLSSIPVPQHEPVETGEPASRKRKRFVDRLVIEVRGGTGGNGAVAYAAARGRKQRAAGGRGAEGGSVIIRASHHVSDLGSLPRHVTAGMGGRGGPTRSAGARGKDAIISVPLGTTVKKLKDMSPSLTGDNATSGSVVTVDRGEGEADDGWPEGPDVGEKLGPDGLPMWMSRPGTPSYGLLDNDSDSDDEGQESADGREQAWEEELRRAEVLADLIHEGQEVVVAEGGRGGLGNSSFNSKPFGPPSEQFEEGHPGTAARLLLEAKLIADVGFVGMPNAGKSTLLSALSAAKARVGSYAFTTLQPQLGTIIFGPRQQRLTLADIPGLIQGAHDNRGRGNRFLRHIERTRCLAFVLDLSGGQQDSLIKLTPSEQLRVLRHELKLYNDALLQVPAVVIANKLDAVTDAAAAIKRLQQHTQLPVVPVSANQRSGLAELVQCLALLLQS